MTLKKILAALFLIFIFATPASAQGPVIDLNQIAFEQQPGAQVPADLAFRDENGNPVTLGNYFGKPMILTLNYFSCPNLCTLELDQLTGAIADLSFNLGDEYEIISVSIDPRETPEIAAQKKWQYVRNYARPGRGAGWHFLTGTEPAIEQLTQTVGFRYAYDAQNDEYAHPIGLIILTPQGQVARYIYGADYPARDLRLALVEASQNKIGSLVDQILLLCYHYDPSTGKYSNLVLGVARATGILTVLGLIVGLGWLWKNDLRRSAH